MTGTNCDLFTHNQSRSYLNHLVYTQEQKVQDALEEKLSAIKRQSGNTKVQWDNINTC
jgi:hypothetical protein